MSSVNARSGVLMFAALWGGACAEDEVSSESLVRQSHMSSPGWNLKGNIFGTGNADEANDVVVSAATGRVYVAGYDNGLLGQTAVEPSGNARGLVLTYEFKQSTQSLDKVALQELGTNSTAESIEALAIAGSDLYFVGRTNGAAPGPHYGQFDVIAGWLPAVGNPRVFQFGTARPQHPRRLTVTSASELVIGGYDDIYIPSNFVEAWEDPFLRKLQRSGNSMTEVTTVWPVQFNTPGSDFLPAMATAQASGSPVYASGSTLTGSGRGMFVKKYASDGVLSWSMQQSAIGLDVAGALSVLPSGNILFAGATYGQAGDQSFGEQDVMVRLIGPEKEILWTKQYGTELSELVTDMAVDAGGNIYVVGETLGSFDLLVPNQGEIDIFLLKLSPAGDLLQSFQLGSPGDDHASSVAVSADGHVYVAGYTTDRLFDNRDPKGGRDGFVFRVTPPGGIGTF